MADGGEAAASRAAFMALAPADQDCVIARLKSLQVLPPGSRHLVVDEDGRPRNWQARFGAPPRSSPDASGSDP